MSQSYTPLFIVSGKVLGWFPDKPCYNTKGEKKRNFKWCILWQGHLMLIEFLLTH